jgi:geranylgeranyl pyrophosphate synthase
MTDVLTLLAPWRTQVESALAAHLESFVDVDGARAPERLTAAMRHALLAGGKRLRPLVTLATAHALHPRHDERDALALAMPAAVALELVHTYSLVHDDLPALDDDDVRRGLPTVHKAFDEATAVLAGDGLLTDAFAVVGGAPRNAAQQVVELARAAGSAGMVGGQHDDVENEGRAVVDASVESLRSVHRRKTGRLFAASAALGALAVQDDAARTALARRYGAALGFAFQVQDDVLDVVGDVDKGGKVRGRDEKLDKLTYVRALGLQGAQALARDAGEEAVTLASQLGPDDVVAVLVQLARFAVQRTH